MVPVMNMYCIIIVGSLLVAYIVEARALSLNMKNLDLPLPQAFQGVYDESKYARSQAYAKATGGLERIGSTLSLVLLLGFMLLGGFNALDILAQRAGLGDIGTGLVYFGLLFVLNDLAGTPFELYRTFVIEERFGFNRTNWRTYLADKLKGLVLSAVIGVPLVGMVLWLFLSFGPQAWIGAWIGVIVAVVGIQYLAPVVILPLFNTFTPLEEGPLRTAIYGYAQRVGFNLSGIFVMDGSKRSAKSNAFFMGFGKRKRIALFDTLIDGHEVEELVAVVAHEVGHYKERHILKGLALAVVKSGIIFYLMSLFLDNAELASAFSMDRVSVHASLVFFLLLYTPVSMLLSLGSKALSRRHEYEADRYAARTTGDPRAMVRALKNLCAANLANLTPHPAYVRLHYAHPPVLERIRALEAAEAVE